LDSDKKRGQTAVHPGEFTAPSSRTGWCSSARADRAARRARWRVEAEGGGRDRQTV